MDLYPGTLIMVPPTGPILTRQTVRDTLKDCLKDCAKPTPYGGAVLQASTRYGGDCLSAQGFDDLVEWLVNSVCAYLCDWFCMIICVRWCVSYCKCVYWLVSVYESVCLLMHFFVRWLASMCVCVTVSVCLFVCGIFV